MKTPTGLQSSVLTLLLLLGVACGGGSEGQVPGEAVPPVDEGTAVAVQGSVDDGRAIFTGKGICATCHGQDGTGTQLAPDLTDDEWINIEPPVTQEKVENLVRTGVPTPKEHPAPMPPMGGASLTDAEIRDVSAYVLTLSQ